MTTPDPIAAAKALGATAARAGAPREAPGTLTAWEAALWVQGFDAERVRTEEMAR